MAESFDTHGAAPLPASEPSVERGHELSDVSLRGIAIAGIVMVACAVVVQIVCWLAMTGMQKPSREGTSHYEGYTQSAPPPAPRLQGSPRHTTLDRRDMVDMRKTEEDRLSSYAWVDSDHHTAQIPIDRAMQIALGRLAPATGPTSQPVSSLNRIPAVNAPALPRSQEQP